MISMQVFQDEHGLLSSMRMYSTYSGEYNDRTNPWCNEIQQNTLIAAQIRGHLFRPNIFIHVCTLSRVHYYGIHTSGRRKVK